MRPALLSWRFAWCTGLSPIPFLCLGGVGTRLLVSTHAGPYRDSEQAVAPQVMQATPLDMIVLADQRLTGYAFWQQAQANGSRPLLRACASQVQPVHQRPSDGSYLSKLYESLKISKQSKRRVAEQANILCIQTKQYRN